MKKHLRTAFSVLTSIAFAALPAMMMAQSTAIVPDPPIGKGVIVLKAALLIDGTGKPEIQNGVVVITNNMITAVGSAGQVQIPVGARVIDLGDATLMPGFIDAHTHVIGRILGDPSGTDAPVKD